MIMEDEWADLPPASTAETAAEPSATGSEKKKRKKRKKPPPLVYPNLHEFVTDYFAQIIRRRLSGNTQVWCAEWWRHPEALSRLTAVWRAWEHLQHEPALGMSTWWLQHCDPHMRALMAPDTGPFSMCRPERHSTDLKPLPLVPAHPSLWLNPAYSSAPDQGDEASAS
ncbi:DUF4913 domain-containing protein [Streptomyces sp. NPDC096136]|uniref:DUF4913 domain-containing protein n=1 Tax=Streptomyces sp. NPDC096136 TaxID=3366076 RepID=UPI00382CBAEF